MMIRYTNQRLLYLLYFIAISFFLPYFLHLTICKEGRTFALRQMPPIHKPSLNKDPQINAPYVRERAFVRGENVRTPFVSAVC